MPVALASCSDERLMARLQAGEIDALGELYDRYAAQAYRLAVSVCLDRCHAEDAVQEAFVSIWRSRSTYHHDRGMVASWLLTVVRHRAIDVERRDGKHSSRTTSDDRLAWHPSGLDLEANVAEADDAGHLRDVLAQLPDAQREVITLAFYGQMTHGEIAEHLRLPPGTVKGRMRLGLERLHKNIMAEASPEEGVL